MNITLRQVRNGQQVLTKVLTNPMDFKVAYRLRKIVQTLEAELKHIEQARIDLVKKYGVEDDKKNTTVSPDKMDQFQKESDELLGMTVQATIDPIPVSCMDGLKLSPIEVCQLEPFLEEEKTSE